MSTLERTFFPAIVLICLLALPLQAQLTEDFSRDVLQDAYLFGDAPNLIMQMDMNIHKRNGTKERDLEIYIQRDATVSKILVQITYPPFLRNMKYLQHTAVDGAEHQWLKTSSGARRLSTSNLGDSLFDSDFAVEDLSSQYDDYAIVKGTDNGNYYLLELKAATGRRDAVGKNVYVDKATKLITQVDFFASNGDMAKQYTVLETREQDQLLFPKRCKMEDFLNGTYTELILNKIEMNKPIPAVRFFHGSL